MTNVISTEGGALCRRSGEIPVFRLLPLLFPLSLYLLLSLLLFVLRRHSERSEESPHFQGERSDPSAFCSHLKPSSSPRASALPKGSLFLFFINFPSKNACQVPKPLNSMKTNHI
jgi:hypothetical protein